MRPCFIAYQKIVKEMFLKIIKIIKLFFIGFPTYLFNYKKLIKIEYVVYLFSSRFGHFLQNTEIFLRDVKSTEKYLFVCEDQIDNLDLFNIWSKHINIWPNSLGNFMRFFLSKKPIHIKSLTVPQNKKYLKNRVIKNIKLNPDYKVLQNFKKKKYVTVTIRDSKYNEKMYNDFRDPFRNTKIKDFKKTINSLNKGNLNFVKVNKSFKKINIRNFTDYGSSNNYNLDTAFSLINEAYYHIGSSTGLDVYAAFADKQLVIFNVFFGSNFMSRLHTVPSMFIPINTFYKKTNRIVPLRKQFEMYNISEKKFNLPHFGKKEMDYFGIYQETNSFDEMKNAIKEYEKLINNSFSLDKETKNVQKSFWKNSPKTWNYNNEIKKINFFNKKFKGSFLISKYYVHKYKEFLL